MSQPRRENHRLASDASGKQTLLLATDSWGQYEETILLYMLIGKDKPGEGLERRMKARPEHLAYLESLGDKIRAAGPFLSEDGKEPRGSVIIFEAASLEEARSIAAADPYAEADVFAEVEIVPWRQGAGIVQLG
jgi:uncharacterized protein YciI